MQEYEVITITISDGTDKEFAIMNRFEVEGQKYIAVSLVVEDEIQEGVYIYRFEETENGEVEVEQIRSEEEYEKVCDVFVALEE